MEAAFTEKRLQLLEQEYKNSKQQFATTIQEKDDALAKFQEQNKQLEKWIIDAQTRLESECSSRSDLETKVAEIKAIYLEETKKNFKEMDDKISQLESHTARIMELERAVDTYKEMLDDIKNTPTSMPHAAVPISDEIAKLVDVRVRQVLDDKIERNPSIGKKNGNTMSNRLRDRTPIFQKI